MKPLKTYDSTTRGAMRESERGDWYAKEEADAVIQRQSDTIQELGLRNAELEAERDAARADAERYRWLREESSLSWSRIGVLAFAHFKKDDAIKAQLDAGIDAARGAE